MTVASSPDKRKRDRPVVRRAKILDEAIRIIGERGYRGFTIQELAQQCGLTNGGLLYHFPSKEDVLTGVLDELERRMTAGVLAYVNENVSNSIEGLGSREMVLQVLRGIVSQTVTDFEINRLLIILQVEALDPQHPAHDRIMASNRSMYERITDLFEPLDGEPVRAARQAIAMLNGLYLIWLEDEAFDLMDEWDRAIAKILPESN